MAIRASQPDRHKSRIAAGGGRISGDAHLLDQPIETVRGLAAGHSDGSGVDGDDGARQVRDGLRDAADFFRPAFDQKPAKGAPARAVRRLRTVGGRSSGIGSDESIPSHRVASTAAICS